MLKPLALSSNSYIIKRLKPFQFVIRVKFKHSNYPTLFKILTLYNLRRRLHFHRVCTPLLLKSNVAYFQVTLRSNFVCLDSYLIFMLDLIVSVGLVTQISLVARTTALFRLRLGLKRLA